MAASEVTAATEARDQASTDGSSIAATVVVCLGPAYQDATPERLEPLLAVLRDAGADAGLTGMLIGYPVAHGDVPATTAGSFTLLPFTQSVSAHTLSVQPAASWLSAFELMRAHNSACCLLLGAEAHTLDPAAIRLMLDAVWNGSIDLALPKYALQPNQGLLNVAMISPLSAAVYGVDVAFPLALDYALSLRMAERMAGAAQRFTTAAQGDALLWPAGEAAVAGYNVAEIAMGHRELPQPQEDLSTILNLVCGSMFSDVEAKASFWQRIRPATEIARAGNADFTKAATEPPTQSEIDELIQSFRIGYSNLHEIWSLVLPPNTLLGLKRLSQMPANGFTMPDSLWVRIVYDFVLAHRLRTISRGHLLGSLTPLYLAWVASHIVANGEASARPGALVRAFEADKPYLVSRWRWPDRFNP